MPGALTLLRRSAPFAAASAATLNDLAAGARWCWPERGQHLFGPGDPVDTLLLPAQAGVRVYMVSPAGRELTLRVDGPQQPVELAAVLGGQAWHGVAAQALGADPQLLCLPAQAVQGAVLHDPALAAATITHLARRTADSQRHLAALVLGGVTERLAAELLRHAAAPWPLPTNSDLAARLGTVPEIVSRKLGEFYRRGVIDLRGRTVTVTEPATLQRLAEGS
ncbi:helix-turn-helix domain-containing protein [Deinococcus sp. HMF7620]|uniref:Helix-turn-helix domain-containing protein n=1 Tax=Deinococcus arboris TaxID=2682977 RepID=A0A7C9LRV2_9DEIO|nr:Crp/Fnr family transcriptional regulator [Deinococcus arboris]MVN87641.1 helix-turn-helix domain-containing protein [Deinococcus arboris]